MIATVENQGMWAFLIDFANRHPLMVIGGLMVIISALSNVSTKKVKVKTNYHMSMWFFLAGLGCMGLDLMRSGYFKEKKPPINQVQASADLKRKVENYLEALATQDRDRVSPFYGSPLSYFGEENVTFGHIWRRMKQEWRKVANQKFEVAWNTWRYRLDEQAEKHIVSFSFKRKFQLEDKKGVGEEQAEDKSIEFTFDRDYKIARIDKPTEN